MVTFFILILYSDFPNKIEHNSETLFSTTEMNGNTKYTNPKFSLNVKFASSHIIVIYHC